MLTTLILMIVDHQITRRTILNQLHKKRREPSIIEETTTFKEGHAKPGARP
jgi:hypothetical protein